MIVLTLWNFLKLTRPLFLLGGALLYALGALIALVEGAVFNPGRFLIGQILVTSIQLMTHYANEYYDLYADRLNKSRTWFSGGSGVLAAGMIKPEMVRWAALTAALAGLFFLFLAGAQVPIVFIVGAISLFAAWSYSAPPLALVSTGWGELAASLIVAFMVPLVGYALQSSGRISPILLLNCLPLILIHFAMLIAFQIPDWQADKEADKRTLSVRIGLARAACLHNILLLLACLLIASMLLAHWPGAQLTWLALPLAVWQAFSIRRFHTPVSSSYLPLTLGAIGLFALTSALWLAGYALSWISN